MYNFPLNPRGSSRNQTPPFQVPNRRRVVNTLPDLNGVRNDEVVNVSLLDHMNPEDFVLLVKTRSEQNVSLSNRMMNNLSQQLKGVRSLLSLQSVLLSRSEVNSSAFDRIIDIATTILSVENVFFLQTDPSGKDLVVTHSKLESTIGSKIPLASFRTDMNSSSGKLLDTNDDNKNRLVQEFDAKIAQGTKNLIFAPVLVDGAIRGQMVARNKLPLTSGQASTLFADGDETVLSFAAVTAGVALRSLSKPTNRSQAGARIRSLSADLLGGSSALEIDVIIQRIIADAYNKIDADKISLFIYDEITNKLECIASHDIKGFRVDADKGIVGNTFRMGGIMNVPDVKRNNNFYAAFDHLVGYQTHSILSAAIVDDDGKSIGVIQALNKRSNRSFNSEDEVAIAEICKQVLSLVHKRRNLDVEKNKQDSRSTNMIKSAIKLINSSNLKVLGSEIMEMLSYIDHDIAGLYSFETDSKGSFYLQKLGSESTESHPPRNNMPTRIEANAVPAVLMDSMRLGVATEIPKNRSESATSLFQFLPDITAHHVLVYPINIREGMPASPFAKKSGNASMMSPTPSKGNRAFVTNHSSPLSPRSPFVQSTSVARAFVLIVGRNTISHPFDLTSKRLLENIVTGLNTTLHNIISRSLQENSTVSMETNHHILNSLMSSLSEYIVILNTQGKTMSINKPISEFFNETGSRKDAKTLTANEHSAPGCHYTELFEGMPQPLFSDVEMALRTGIGQGRRKVNDVEYQILAIGRSGVLTSDNSPTERSDKVISTPYNAGFPSADDDFFAVAVIFKPYKSITSIPQTWTEKSRSAQPSSQTATDLSKVSHLTLPFNDKQGVNAFKKNPETYNSPAMKAVREITAKVESMINDYNTSDEIQDDMHTIGLLLANVSRKIHNVENRVKPTLIRGQSTTTVTQISNILANETELSSPEKTSVVLAERSQIVSLVHPGFIEPENLHSWDFCTLDVSDKICLCSCIGRFFEEAINFSELGVNPVILARYIVTVSDNYHDNPFHNFQHAAGVVHFAFMLITMTHARTYLDHWKLFGVLFSAVVHDVDHPGNTNAFETNSGSILALRYNDLAVLENHHCSTAFRLLRKEGRNFTLDLEKSVVADFRKTVVSCILATDMAVHFHLADEAKKYAANFATNEDEIFNEQSDKIFLCKILLHAADLSNPVRPFNINKRWATRVSIEFNAQVAKEEELGLPILSFMITRDEKALCKNELGFSSFVVGPMWKSLAIILPAIKPLTVQLETNLGEWKKLLEEITEREAAEEKMGKQG